MEASSAQRMFSTAALRSSAESAGLFTPPNTLEARTRSSFIAERQRANTASAMSVSGTP